MLHSASLPTRCGIATLSGVAYALAFPPLGWRWLVVPGIAGLLLSLQGLRGAQARGIGFLHGMTAYAVGVPWMWLLFGVQAVALWAILAAFTAAFAGMQSRAEARGWSGWRMVAFILLNWGGWEFIRAELFPLKFPWMTAGPAWGPNLLLPWVGVYGVSAIVVSGVSMMTAAPRWWKLTGLLPLAWLCVALMEGPGTLEKHDKTVIVGAVQLEEGTLKRYAQMTRTLEPDTVHVCWPEYALPYDVRVRKRDMEALQALCAERNITLTVGTQTGTADGSGWHNTALTLDANGVLGEHHKMHPVHFFDDGIPGTSAVPVETPHGKVGTPICFDCDYEGPARRMTAAGAEAFIVPSMDAFSWGEWQHLQHSMLFRIRACENARWMLVCASSGVSQCIDEWGFLVSEKAALKEGVLWGLLQRNTHLTFYTRWGWLTPWCVLGAASLCWIILLLPRRAAKDTPS